MLFYIFTLSAQSRLTLILYMAQNVIEFVVNNVKGYKLNYGHTEIFADAAGL